MKRLIVIEGFDRSGKDTLMQDLGNSDLPNTWVYFNDLEGLPKYDKEQDDFLVWLNKLIQMQVNKLNELFDKYDNVIMTRFIVSDEVYSTLFNREHTVIKYIGQLRKDVQIINYCLLFNTWTDYLKRLELLEVYEAQYDNSNFYEINNLYKNELIKYKGSRIFYIKYNTSKLEILEDFIEYVYKSKLQ